MEKPVFFEEGEKYINFKKPSSEELGQMGRITGRGIY
jgi:hypothetical protein